MKEEIFEIDPEEYIVFQTTSKAEKFPKGRGKCSDNLDNGEHSSLMDESHERVAGNH